MIRRLLFLIVFVVCLPLLPVAMFCYLIIGVICAFVWVINGDEKDILWDYIEAPISLWINLPSVIMGEKMSFIEMCEIDLGVK